VAESFIASIDHDGDGALSADEQRGYAGQVLSALEVELDEAPVQPHLLSWSFPDVSALRRGESAIRLNIQAGLPRVGVGSHRLLFRNTHLAGHGAYLANALVPESARIRVTAQRRAADQSELTIEYALEADAAGAVLPWIASTLAAALLTVRFRRLRHDPA
jgi:hypothetical protein